MRNHKGLNWCHVAQKYSYSSEAKADKFVKVRPDLKRSYYCSHCDGYHTTSMDMEKAVKYVGLEIDETPVTLDNIQKRLKELTQKL